jgi:nicotinamide-nucleotide amidase
MTAEIVSVGTELLLGQIVDTHAPVMAQLLASCGIACQRRATLGDNFDRLVAGLTESLARSDMLVTIGGLGPTQDDLTRDAIAAALDDNLVVEPRVEAALRKFFADRGVRFAESNAKQAQRPESATLIDNPNGTAPGLLCQKNGKVVIALPGPAGEFNPMAFGPVKTFLETVGGAGVILSRSIRIDGVGESAVEERVRHLMDGENPTVAPYVQMYDVVLRVTARAASRDEANQLIDPVEAKIRAILGDAVYGIDATTFEESIVRTLIERGKTIAVAESITGGGIGARITSVAGSSQAFVGGLIAYSNQVKTQVLGLPAELLATHGPVSPEVAIAMAESARTLFRADYAIALTGNAGPTVDVDNKAVGLTYAAVAGPNGTAVDEAKYRGIREDVRRRATQLGLRMLRRSLLESS